tara:strand:+ start:1777 stop:2451 length:675 start_codon:yes stop_codon:yes gene_type:complete
MTKSIIIDFDNTIGYFKQIVYIINIVEKTYNKSIQQKEINVILDKYLKIFRPKFLQILKLFSILKKKNKIKYFIIYTCNNKEIFVNMVINYIYTNIQIDKKLFDYIIFQKKKEKNINTLKKFTNNNINNHKLCFIDNKKYYYDNNDTNIYYITCDSYKYIYSMNEIINNFPFDYFKRINTELIIKYFKIINNKKNNNECNKIPLRMYELESQNIINFINKFIHL